MKSFRKLTAITPETSVRRSSYGCTDILSVDALTKLRLSPIGKPKWINKELPQICINHSTPLNQLTFEFDSAETNVSGNSSKSGNDSLRQLKNRRSSCIPKLQFWQNRRNSGHDISNLSTYDYYSCQSRNSADRRLSQPEIADISSLQNSETSLTKNNGLNEVSSSKIQSFIKQPSLSPCFENKIKVNRFNFAKDSPVKYEDQAKLVVQENYKGIRRSSYHMGVHKFIPASTKETKEFRRQSLISSSEAKLNKSDSCTSVLTAVKKLSKPLKLGSTVGQGGFGKVTVCLWNDIKVAMKHIGSGKLSSVPHEANFVGLHHPSLVKTYAVLTDDSGYNYTGFVKKGALVVSELCTTVTMQTFISTQEVTLSYRDKIRIFQQLCSGLEYLHNKNLAHLDVKPANCFFTNCGNVKLGDFGCCSKIGEKAKNVIGTAAYQSPEVLRGEIVSNKSDVYSLGVTAWSLISLRIPYDGLHPHVIIYKVTRLGHRPSKDINTSWAIERPSLLETLLHRIIEQCWRTEPSQRPSVVLMKSVLGALCVSAAND